MHPAEIQAALKLRGYSQAAIAEEIGVKPSTVSMVINGRGRSAQAEARIAAITGYALAELWPQWHGDAKPLVLTSEERTLILRYRELAPWQREQILPVLRTMLSDAYSLASRGAGMPIDASASNVTISAGKKSRVAGRDFIETEPSTGKGSGKPSKRR